MYSYYAVCSNFIGSLKGSRTCYSSSYFYFFSGNINNDNYFLVYTPLFTSLLMTYEAK